MAKPKNPGGKRAPDRRRRPGESPEAWTVRNAYLSQNPGSGRWIIHYTEAVETNGRVTYRTNQQACFTTDKAEAHERLIAWGEARLTPVVKALMFPDLAGKYMRDRSQKTFTRSHTYKLKPALTFFTNDTANGITRARLDDYQDHLKANGLAPGTIRDMLIAVLTVLRHGAKHDLIPTDAVPFRYDLPAGGAPRSYVLTPDETNRVFDHAASVFMCSTAITCQTPDARAALFMCVATDSAQRRGAILAITWDRINLTPGHEAMDFRRPGRRPKNKHAAAMPIASRLLPVLQHAATHAKHDASGEPVGPLFDSVKLWPAFDRLRDELGLPGLTPHVFRHTWATEKLKNGMPPALVARWMGDGVATVLRNYTHVTIDDLREAMRKYL